MTTDEARKFFDELPKFVDVPTGDGSGDIVKVHKSHPMRDDVNRIIADLERQATAAQEETENLALLRAEALRRGCKPDQPIGEAFPEGLRIALAKLRGVAVQ